MAGSKAKLNLRGINQVLKLAQPVVDEIGRDIAADAGAGYRYVSNPHKFTARGHVETEDVAAAAEDARTNALLRAVGQNIR